MLAATAWNSLVAIITEHAAWVETGRSAFPLPMRLWTHFLKQLYEFRVPVAEDELHLTSIFRAFAGLDHGSPLSPSAQDKLLDAVVARCGHSFDAGVWPGNLPWDRHGRPHHFSAEFYKKPER